MSKNKRRLTSPDVISIRNSVQNNTRLPLFIKKSNDEGLEFYFMGDCSIMQNSIKQDKMVDGKPVVHFTFEIDEGVEDGIYNYLTKS